MRRTKIIVTLGPATDAPGKMDNLIAAGMDCARLNCSHADADGLRARAAEVRAAAERAGRPVALMFDLQGPKIRLSAVTDKRSFVIGEPVCFAAIGCGADGDLEVGFADFAALCTEQSQLVIGDGELRFQVTAVEGARVHALASSAGALGPRKGISVTQAHPMLPALTEKDLADIATAVEVGVDFMALSFVRSAEDVVALQKRLRTAGSEARIIAKIEKVEAVANLGSILAVSDGLMVARGDYGVEAGIAQVPHMQKEVIHHAVQAGRLVVTATQMLESMIACAEPTRAEALDVYNSVLDGTSAMMLSAETSVGQFPVQAVSMMAEIAELAEGSDDSYRAAPSLFGEELNDAAVMHAAVALARDTKAAALIVPTSTGGTARACAKYRPSCRVVALCHDSTVANQLALEWGVQPAFMRQTGSADELVAEALRAAVELEGLAPGDTVVITSGPTVGHSGATNLITLKTL